MVYNNLAIPTTLINSDVNCAILGYLENDQTEVKLHYIGKHFYLKATVFDGLYNYVDYNIDFESWYYDSYDDFRQDNMVYGLH
eukprot:4122123-Amphidinium_carterae.2